MPRQLFDEVTHPTVQVGSRSRYTVLVSMVVHALVAGVVVIVPLMASDVLPEPHRVIGAFTTGRAAPPPPPPPAATASTPSSRPVDRSPAAVPTTAPVSSAPEGFTTASVLGEPGGVEGGVPGGLGTPGLVPGPPAMPPPSAVPQRPLPIGGRIKEPSKLRHVPPVYRVIAQQARVEGVVIIEATIGVDGRVQQGARAAIEGAARRGGARGRSSVGLHAVPAERCARTRDHDGDRALHVAVGGGPAGARDRGSSGLPIELRDAHEPARAGDPRSVVHARAGRPRRTAGADGGARVRPDAPSADPTSGRALGKRLGVAAILFFTVKGLLWLIVPFAIYQFGC